jgi:hypothetical protein
MVCHEIRNGEIIFMPESSHDWKWEVGQLSANVCIIKDHQIFSAPSPSGDHDCIQSELLMVFRKATKNSANDRRYLPLYGDRHHKELA